MAVWRLMIAMIQKVVWEERRLGLCRIVVALLEEEATLRRAA